MGGLFSSTVKSDVNPDFDIKKYIDESIRESIKEAIHEIKHREVIKDDDGENNEEFENLKKKHEALLGRSSDIPKSVISDKAIGSFVQKLIDDPDTNIYGFPDRMEKALYNKLLKTILHAVAHVSDESAILLFGHRIRIMIQPLDGEKAKSEEM
jgi:hypothetical protein